TVPPDDAGSRPEPADRRRPPHPVIGMETLSASGREPRPPASRATQRRFTDTSITRHRPPPGTPPRGLRATVKPVPEDFATVGGINDIIMLCVRGDVGGPRQNLSEE
ncbi:MAG: hypothetical protein ACTHOR_15690, partial [Devosia sp.]